MKEISSAVFSDSFGVAVRLVFIKVLLKSQVIWDVTVLLGEWFIKFGKHSTSGTVLHPKRPESASVPFC